MPDVSIRRVSELIKDIENGTLIPRPAFQRRLVWTNIVKDHFLETVTLGLPFPEIFIGTGEIDTRTMDRKNLLVDGQQRISTLREYVQGSPDLVLNKVKPYAKLSEADKARFLDYKVAVRDLGQVTKNEITEIFARINSTDYALKAMERLNAQFSGAFKQFCDTLSRDDFFDRHDVFSMADLRRMRDLDFCVILTITLMSTYYNRDSLNKEYLHRFNDAFPQMNDISHQIQTAFEFIEQCGFEKKCRVWKKTDLFTLIVELHAFLSNDKPLVPETVGSKLSGFYDEVNKMFKMEDPDEELASKSHDVFRYLKAATKATSDKYARVDRGEVISSILQSTLIPVIKAGKGKKSKAT